MYETKETTPVTRVHLEHRSVRWWPLTSEGTDACVICFGLLVLLTVMVKTC